MSVDAPNPDSWPTLPPLEEWQETLTAVHLWTQIVGKVRLELSPWINHSWGSTLYVTSRGLTTSPIPYRGESFAIDFDFVDHALRISTSWGRKWSMGLGPMSVSDFYRELMGGLTDLRIEVSILARPVEVEVSVPFAEDRARRPYDAADVHAFWRALVQVDRVFKRFRAGFVGKSSPAHFFWGAFDLAVTRFSGRPAPKHPGGAPNVADWVMEEAYSDELASAGFWPGTGLGEAAFYAYAYPEPEGYRAHPVHPAGASFHPALGEFVLPYEEVRSAPDPDAALREFLESTYAAAADLGGWDRSRLERVLPPK
ncbi:MAG: DUF5996 family protein [Gemmatimonadota bacterium]|nr:DUF5996 family protein [Gemmatimonadota bacterium]